MTSPGGGNESTCTASVGRHGVSVSEGTAKYPGRVSLRILLGILTIHTGLLAWGAWTHSPTIDEGAYLAAGVSHWHFGRFDLTRVSPPLVRLVAGGAVSLQSPSVDWKNYRIGPGIRSEHAVGSDFMVANGPRTFWLFTVGRWSCIPFSWLGAWVCYRWAGQLWGAASALMALTLWCFSPNILAHGQLLTPDVGVTACSVFAAYRYWRWSTQPGWIRALLAGASLGLAILAKTNAIALVPVLPLVALLAVRSVMGWSGLGRAWVQLAVSLVAMVYVLNLGYGFEGSLVPLGKYEFVSQTFRGAGSTETLGNRYAETWLGAVPVPVPRAFLEGIDLQRKDFENQRGHARTYFRGEWYTHGWWWYYFYVVLIKEPLGAWLLLVLALGTWIRAGGGSLFRSPLTFILGSGLALFGLACSQTGFGHALRYVLPAFPFAFLFASSVVRTGVRSRLLIAAARLGLAAHVVSSLWTAPHSLSYFNAIAGGPVNGHAHLLDGNLDWGQDLLYLERWIAAHPDARPLHVSYWGFLPRKALGTTASDFEVGSLQDREDIAELPAGWYAVSVNQIRGDFRIENRQYRRFLNLPVHDRVGYTLQIFHFPEPVKP